ncbi:M23 family metallopeptidase [Streptomyces sp. PLK6-54]|uniref:M23 family metallopeptidase n=2 Tax=Actinacidiphila acidipaludis TaxID=2873382 RepID=A0ABS7QBF4_9ACTN|nr:M23 family metallopeptidase [Streptomyces acidipaludis]
MAAVGAAGVAAAAPTAPAQGAAPVAVSVPDVVPADAPAPAAAPAEAVTPVVAPSVTPVPGPAPTAAPAVTDPGEALRARIIGQATAEREAAAQAERDAAAKVAAEHAAREAAARKVREQAAAAKAAAEAKAKADAEAAAQAESERRAALAASYIKPLASATLTAAFGESDPWSNLHTGQDFAAPTGTPVHAVHGGTVTSAGWAGPQGYRVVVTLDDGTQVWYCHLSTMCVTEGRVTTGDTVGRVGATGNVTAPHLHLEVRPGGGAPVDPVPWLQAHDVAV